ncbi:MAG: aromatic acid decarboxylase [Deltaproteobacteria bacterium HGW-Deltaproteobacteria-4]|nr:MAG: aromatic acid decarboxylase [Deltaproteobacteria bacterium HGW-Deltaproteobacteria-4]
MKNIVVAICGASGSIYGLRLVEELLKADCRVTLLLTDAGRQVLHYETGLDWPTDIEVSRELIRSHFASYQLRHYANNDLFAPVASGTSAPDALVIVPCSMGTLGRVASGAGSNLIERVADVVLKERRELLIVPRETPLSSIHLRNLLTVAECGAQIIPAMPAFYRQPQTVADLVDFVIGKILDSLRIKHALFIPWGEEP